MQGAGADGLIHAVAVQTAEPTDPARRWHLAVEVQDRDSVADEVRDKRAAAVGRDDDRAGLAGDIDGPADREGVDIEGGDLVGDGRGHEDISLR